MESPAVPALLIGALFVEKGLITQEQLDVALEEQQRTGNRLGEVLVERFGVSRLDLASALAEQWAEYERQGTVEQQESHSEVRDLVAVSDEWSGASEDEQAAPKRPIGEIFLERGMVSSAELDIALEEQRASGRRLGEILVGQGNLSRLELASALADQWATFQKLRPPAGSNGAPPQQSADSDRAPVMPTPEVSSAIPLVPAAPSDQVDALRGRLEALGAQLEQLSSTTSEWREPLEQLSASVAERLAAVEQAASDRSAAAPSDDASRAEIVALVTRVDELAASILVASSDSPPADLADRVEQLAAAIAQQEVLIGELAKEPVAQEDRVDRTEIAALEARLEALARQPASSQEWREPLESLANDLLDRIATIEHTPAPESDEAIHVLRAEVASLAARIDAAPAPSEDWRADVAALDARFGELSSRSTAGDDELRAEIATLRARVKEAQAPTDESRMELGRMAEELGARLEHVEAGLATRAENGAIAELGSRLAELADRVPEGVDELHQQVAELVSRVDAIPAPSEGWRDELHALTRRLDELPLPNEDWRAPLDGLNARVDAVPEDLRARLDRIDNDLAATVDAGAITGLSESIAELRVSQHELSERLDAIPPNDEWRHALAEVAENLRARLEGMEAALEQRPGIHLLAGLRDELQALSDRIDSDLRERDERAAGHSAHVEWLADRVSQSDGLEQRLRDDFAPLVEGAVGSLAERLEEHARRIEELRDDGPTAAQVAEALGGRLEASEAVATDVYAAFDERLAALDERVAAASGRAVSDVESLKHGLDDLRGAVAGAEEASKTDAERLDHAVLAQAAVVEALQAGIDERERVADERLSALERAQAKRSDIRELRDSLARVEKHIAAEAAQEDTRVVAVEEAVREGLAALASRLSESEGAYLQAGDSLRRSIEHLGSAIRGADAHLAPSQDVAEVAPIATSFLAFAPISDGYHLVELDGPAPIVGALVDVPGSETRFTVVRLGASPLPFDRRPCAYLETSQ